MNLALQPCSLPLISLELRLEALEGLETFADSVCFTKSVPFTESVPFTGSHVRTAEQGDDLGQSFRTVIFRSGCFDVVFISAGSRLLGLRPIHGLDIHVNVRIVQHSLTLLASFPLVRSLFGSSQVRNNQFLFVRL